MGKTTGLAAYITSVGQSIKNILMLDTVTERENDELCDSRVSEMDQFPAFFTSKKSLFKLKLKGRTEWEEGEGEGMRQGRKQTKMFLDTFRPYNT